MPVFEDFEISFWLPSVSSNAIGQSSNLCRLLDAEDHCEAHGIGVSRSNEVDPPLGFFGTSLS